jgi:uncharacterized delta-60 repeat protein
MLFQPVSRRLHLKLSVFALFIIALTAIIFGSVKSSAESNNNFQNRQANPILAQAKADKRRPEFEPSRRAKREAKEFNAIFKASRTTDIFEALTSGDLDTTFGTGGKVTTAVGSSASEAFAVAVQADGKFVSAGYSLNAVNRDFALVRYEANGTLDTSFGTGGKVTTDIGNDHNEILALAIQPADGKLIAAGYSSNGVDDDFTLARYNPNGTLDNTFGTGGIARTNFNNSFDYAEALVIQPDGKIVAAGFSFNGAFYDFALARYNADGTPDNTFGTGGKVTTDFAGGDDLALSLALQADGKLVAAGLSAADFGVARYNSDGSLDTGFDTDGRVTTSIGAFDLAYAVAAQADGKIVIAGETDNGVSSDFALVRYESSGALDTTFDGDGKVTTPIGSGNEFAEALLIQSSGKIIAAGHSFNNGNADFALARYNADGALDATFGTGGKVTTDFGNSANDFIAALALPSASRLIAVGGSGSNFAAAAYVLETPTCSYSLSATSANFTAAGGTGSVNVTTANGCGWTAVSNADWISITGGASGNGNGTVNYTVQANTGPARSGTVTIAGQTYTINQASGCTFSIAPASANFTASAGSGSFSVTAGAGCAWTATTNDAWISITSGAGSGNGSVSFNVQANVSPARTGTITVAGQTFTINQASGCAYTLPVNSASVPSSSGTGSFNINSGAGCSWTATSNALWISITAGSSGSGNGTVSYSYQPNPGVSRTGTITAGGQTFTVIQANGCTYGINPANQSFTAAGGGGGFSVTSSDGSCLWNSSSNSPWITITGGASGNGNGTVSFTVAANTGAARTGTITSAGQTFTVNQASGIVALRTRFDYDGDGKADLSVFRPSAGDWYLSYSSNNAFIALHFGASGDLIAPADFDGDGKTDISVFRPTDGGWYRLNSSNNTFSALQFGTNGDLPVPGDFDGDLKADICVYRPSAGSWYRINSSNQQFIAAQFGVAEDKPLVGDFDGDGKSDLAVFRPSNGTWYRINSATDTFSPNQFGATGDLPVAADYDGDGKTDLAVYRPSVGDWYIINSSNSSFTGLHFGVTEDKPTPADFDGDGKADLVVFRPSSGTWYLLRTTAGFTGFQFGASGDVPTPNAFVR